MSGGRTPTWSPVVWNLGWAVCRWLVHGCPERGEWSVWDFDESTRGAIEVEGDEEQERDQTRGQQQRGQAASKQTYVEPDQEHGACGADHFEHEHLGRYAVVQSRHAYRLLIDHCVETVFVQSRGSRSRFLRDRLPG